MRTTLITLISLFALLFSSQSLAAAVCKNNGDCCKELNRMWQEHFSQDFEMLSSSSYKLKDNFQCPSEQSKLAEGFNALYELSSSAATSLNYYNEMKSTMSSAGYGVVILKLPGAFSKYSPAMLAVIFSATNSDDLSPSTYASQAVHESQHVNGGPVHVECLQGQLMGKLSCDSSIGEGLSTSHGSYTGQFSFLHDLRRSEATDLYKKTSRRMMQVIFENQINNKPQKGPDGSTPFRKYYDI